MIRKFALLFLIFLMILTAVNVIAEEEFVSISVSPYVLLGNDAEIEVDEHLISFTAEIIHFGEEKTETVCEMNYPDENTQGRKLVISKEYLTVKNGLYYLNIDNVKTDEGYNFAGDKSHYGFAVLKTAPTKLTIIASTSKPRLSDTAAFWAYSPNIDESISVCFEDETLSDININWSFVRWVFEATGKESVYAVAIDKNGKETKSSSLDLTITSVGSLGTVDWTVNPVIPTKDDDLSITIRPTAEQKAITNVPLYYELIVYDMDDNWNKSAYSCWKSFWQGADDPEQAYMSLIGDSGTLVVKAQEHADNDDPILNPDHHYRIDAYVYTPGYEEAHASQFMFISGAKGENAPVLKINGESGETVEVQARKDFRLQVTLPQNATAFRAYTGYNYETRWDWSVNDEESWGSGLDHFANLSINDPAVYPFHVQATTHVFSEGEGPWDLKEDDWNTPISNVVMLKVTADGRVGRADASLEKDTVNRGDLLPVTITSAGDGTEWLGLYIADVDSDWLRASAETKTIYYPTSRLKAGKYALVIESCAEGKVSARRQLSFTVEEKETEQIHFEVGADTAIKNEEIPVSVYAPDAIWIRVCGKNVDRPWDGEREYFFENGPAVGGNIGLEAGTNILWAEACFENDEIAEGEEIVKSKEYIIEVNSLGKLTACPITVDALQSPGKDVIIRVDGLAAYENDWWDLHVWDESAESEDDDFDNTILRKTVRTSETVESFTVPASILKKNHRYHVNVWVDRDGYNGADSDTYFYIIDAENDENVSLEIRKADGEFTNTDIKDAQIRSQAFFRLTAPKTATAFMKFNGHNWHDQEIDDGIATWEEKLDTDNTAYAVRCWYGDREVFYQMLEDNNWQPDWEYNDSDGNHFGGLSNVVTVSFAPFGYAESPIVSFPEYSEDGATRGTHLMVDVNTTEYGINAVSAWVENEEIGFGLDGVSFPYEFGIPTARLTEGEYTLRVSVSGPGKNWSEAISLPFTVIENTDEPVFSVAGQCGFEPNVGVYYYHLDDDLFYTGYASGEYDHMKVIFSEDEDGKNVIDIREYNDPFDDNFHLEHPGQFFIRMVAFINSDESDESPWFNNIPIIIDPVGEFEPFGIEVAPVFTEEEAANGVTFTVEGPENAGYGWWDIWVDDLWEDTEMPRWNRDEDPVSNTFTIPADKLKPDHSYRIHMYVDADGYIGMGTEATFSIVKAIDNTIKLTINGQSGKATVPCYTDFTMRVEAQNAQMVSFFDGNDWWLLYPEFDPNTNVAEFTNGADMAPGEYTLLVRATDDPDFWNNFDKDHPWEWSDMKINWRAVGEPFKLTVISNGDLAEPHMDLRVPEEGVIRGELIEAVISYPKNEPVPERVRINIRDEYENREYYWSEYWPEQFPFTMMIPTTTMGEGNYRADVELIKSGYNAVFVPDEDVPFRVRETDEDMVFRAELPKNRNLLPHEDFLVSAYVKGAERLELYASDVKQASENPDYYEPDRWNFDGDSFADDSISVNEGEHELYLLAYGPGFNQNGTKILYENHLIARPEEGKRMQPAEIDMKLIEEVGKPHTFVVSGIERADWWWNVNIWDEENGMPVIDWNRDNTTNRTEFTIPSDKLEDGHRYNIDIWLDAKYLGGAGMSMRFAVVDPEKKAELILPAAVNKVESGAFSNLGDKQLLIISGGKEGTKLEDGSFAENDALIAVQLPEGFDIGEHWEAFPLGEATVIEFISD